jgi:hypothetical protein
MGFMLVSACTAAQDDPFGATPKGVSPNCGPEHRYKYEQTIRSSQDFADFLKQHADELKDKYGNRWVRLDNFKTITPGVSYEQMQQTPVDWEKVRKATTVETLKGRTVYRLDFEPLLCVGQSFTLKMTNDGHVSLYGCCGK